MTGCTLLATVMHMLVRQVSADLHPFEIAFFRNFLGLFLLAGMFHRAGWGALRSNRMGLHLARAATNSLAMLGFFVALSITPFATVTALGFTAPLFAAIGAALFLGERMRARRWIATIVGFVGMLVIVRPGVAQVGLGEVLMIVSAAGWSVSLLLIKSMTRTDSAVTITAYMNLLLTPITLAFAVFVWTWPTLAQLGWLTVIAMLGTLAQIALNQALRHGDVAAIMPIEFVRLIWASAIAILVFGEPQSPWVWLGSAIIVASTSYIAYRESRVKGKADAKPVPPE